MPTSIPDPIQTLAPFFAPKGIAVVGATRDPNKLGYAVMQNLTDASFGFPGPIYPVNPKADELFGLPCYHDVARVPDPVDLAVVIIAAGAVPGIVEACGQRGIRAVIVMSGGFREVGARGALLETQMRQVAERYGVRILGPNGIGVIDTSTPLNTTFVPGMPARGHIAFASQSGALCGAIIDWSIGNRLGFSRLVSLGNATDVNETDILPVLARDDASRVVALYLEGVRGGPSFVAALGSLAAAKPVLALKTGRSASGQLATASHTGALASSYSAFQAACKRAGAIEVQTVEALFNGAMALAYQPPPRGNRLGIVTNSGGPAALAADMIEPAGLRLARTSAETRERLRQFLHADAQLEGPVDLLGAADERQYGRATSEVLADDNVDGALIILVPQMLIDAEAVVAAVSKAAREQPSPPKPVLLCLMGEASVRSARVSAHACELPVYSFPEAAVQSFEILRRRAHWFERGDRTSAPEAVGSLSDNVDVVSRPAGEAGTAERQSDPRSEAQSVLTKACAAKLSCLGPDEAKLVVETYGIRTPPEGLARDEREAREIAARLGFPVAMKLSSPDVLHKSDVGGVILDVGTAQDASDAFSTLVARAAKSPKMPLLRGVLVQKMVRQGHHVIVGMKRDETFGPLMMFGLGGIYVEVLADVSFRLAPLTATEAEDMVNEVRSAKLLDGVRGAPPADRAALIAAIVALSHLAANHPEISEFDVNPLVVMPEGQGVTAVDVRFLLSDQGSNYRHP